MYCTQHWNTYGLAECYAVANHNHGPGLNGAPVPLDSVSIGCSVDTDTSCYGQCVADTVCERRYEWWQADAPGSTPQSTDTG